MSKLYRSETPKGAGDGAKEARLQVPSSRKFTPTPIRDDTVQLRLKKVLDDIETKQVKLRKAKSVAEITPTKTKRRRPKQNDGGSSVALHATPRPQETPSRRDALHKRLEERGCRRMLLFVWRRNRKRLAMVSESLRRRQEQIFKLENQISCLKDLTQSECRKRSEAIQDCQKAETALQAIKMENTALFTAKIEIQNEVTELQKVLHSSNINLENLKNELNSRTVLVKRLENDLSKEKHLVKSLQEQRSFLSSKVTNQDLDLKMQQQAVEVLTQNLQATEKELKDVLQSEDKIKLDCDNLDLRYRGKKAECEVLEGELAEVKAENAKLAGKINDLEAKLVEAYFECERVLRENQALEHGKSVWVKAKNLAQISWRVLQHAAYIMLPAL